MVKSTHGLSLGKPIGDGREHLIDSRARLRDKYLVKALLESGPTKFSISLSQTSNGLIITPTSLEGGYPDEIINFMDDTLDFYPKKKSQGFADWDLKTDEFFFNGLEIRL